MHTRTIQQRSLGQTHCVKPDADSSKVYRLSSENIVSIKGALSDILYVLYQPLLAASGNWEWEQHECASPHPSCSVEMA